MLLSTSLALALAPGVPPPKSAGSPIEQTRRPSGPRVRGVGSRERGLALVLGGALVTAAGLSVLVAGATKAVLDHRDGLAPTLMAAGPIIAVAGVGLVTWGAIDLHYWKRTAPTGPRVRPRALVLGSGGGLVLTGRF